VLSLPKIIGILHGQPASLVVLPSRFRQRNCHFQATQRLCPFSTRLTLDESDIQIAGQKAATKTRWLKIKHRLNKFAWVAGCAYSLVIVPHSWECKHYHQQIRSNTPISRFTVIRPKIPISVSLLTDGKLKPGFKWYCLNLLGVSIAAIAYRIFLRKRCFAWIPGNGFLFRSISKAFVFECLDR